MTALIRGVAVGCVQVALVLAIGAKAQMERENSPRVWVKTEPVDPNLPVRGRYVRLRLRADARGFPAGAVLSPATLSVSGEKLIARPSANPSDVSVTLDSGSSTALLAEPVTFFIPQNAPDPSRRAIGEELWVEVTVPSQGPPRAIRLGVKKDNLLTPLAMR